MRYGSAFSSRGSIRQMAGDRGSAEKTAASLVGSNSTLQSKSSTIEEYYVSKSGTGSNGFHSLRTQQPGCNHQPLNFTGAFVNFGDAGVAVIPFDGIFTTVPVPAVNLNRSVCDASRHFTRKELGRRRVHAEACPGILLPRRFADKQARRVELRRHIR